MDSDPDDKNVAAVVEAGPDCRALLIVLREAHRACPAQPFLTAESAQKRWIRLLEELGVNYMAYPNSPWRSLSEPARTLERLGLVEIDAGMASYVQPGQPAPIADDPSLGITPCGINIADRLTAAS